MAPVKRSRRLQRRSDEVWTNYLARRLEAEGLPMGSYHYSWSEEDFKQTGLCLLSLSRGLRATENSLDDDDPLFSGLEFVVDYRGSPPETYADLKDMVTVNECVTIGIRFDEISKEFIFSRKGRVRVTTDFKGNKDFDGYLNREEKKEYLQKYKNGRVYSAQKVIDDLVAHALDYLSRADMRQQGGSGGSSQPKLTVPPTKDTLTPAVVTPKEAADATKEAESTTRTRIAAGYDYPKIFAGFYSQTITPRLTDIPTPKIRDYHFFYCKELDPEAIPLVFSITDSSSTVFVADGLQTIYIAPADGEHYPWLEDVATRGIREIERKAWKELCEQYPKEVCNKKDVTPQKPPSLQIESVIEKRGICRIPEEGLLGQQVMDIRYAWSDENPAHRGPSKDNIPKIPLIEIRGLLDEIDRNFDMDSLYEASRHILRYLNWMV